MANALVNAEIFKAGVDSKIGAKRKLIQFVEQESVEGLQVGTVNVVTNTYVGDATVVGKGVQIPLSDLVQAETPVKFEKIAKGVVVTDEERKQGFGDPIGNAENQTVMAIDGKAEAKLADLLKTATFSVEYPKAKAVNAGSVLEAIGVMGEGIEDAPYFLVVRPEDFANIQLELKASDNTALNSAVYGATLVMSTRIEAKTAYLVQEGALKEIIQKDVDVEVARNAGKKQDEIYTDLIHAVYVQDQSKLVKIKPSVA